MVRPEAEPFRSRAARESAERALVRILQEYDGRPEFVVLGGLVPELLCAGSAFRHAGTTDVDVQVDLEIAFGAVNTARLEQALHNAEFVPEEGQIWRWVATDETGATVVKFELLADLRDERTEATIFFDRCKSLGALNLRGTGFASRDVEVRELKARFGGVTYQVEVNVTGLAGFLLAKTAAAFSRRKAKDWYDIAFVLIHNDAGGPVKAAKRVRERFIGEIGAVRTALNDLRANFAASNAQGTQAYVQQMHRDHPDLHPATLAADAMLAVEEFHGLLQPPVE